MVKHKKLLNVILVILLPLFVHSQNLEGIKKESGIISLLCHNWNIDFKTDSLVKQLPPAEISSTIKFISDGSVLITTGSPVKGYWNYDKKSQNLILKMDNKVLKWKILKLTDKEMVLEMNDDIGVSKRKYLWRDN